MGTLIFVLVVVLAMSLGGYLYRNPQAVISLQQKFYIRINWRMEPVSMPKEIRHTQLMGMFLVIFSVVSCIYYWLRP